MDANAKHHEFHKNEYHIISQRRKTIVRHGIARRPDGERPYKVTCSVQPPSTVQFTNKTPQNYLYAYRGIPLSVCDRKTSSVECTGTTISARSSVQISLFQYTCNPRIHNSGQSPDFVSHTPHCSNVYSKQLSRSDIGICVLITWTVCSCWGKAFYSWDVYAISISSEI